MKTRALPVDQFLTEWQSAGGVLFDSRSPSEYQKGHIPGASSLPLLNDEHRHEIGVIYKQKGRQEAVLAGFERVGPLFHQIIQNATNLSLGKPVYIYCWRGGMRSNISAWLLSMAGMQVTLLEHGYKSFRNLVLREFEKPRKVLVLGGKTGSGKTDLLPYLADQSNEIIDLEKLANHKGSAFGALGLPPQPSQEHFENLLASELMAGSNRKTLWLENESRQIGNVNLPNSVYEWIRGSNMIAVDPGDAARKERILNDYGCFPIDELAERTERIGKRLGNNHLKSALEALKSNDLKTWLDIILVYYDKAYNYGNELRDPSKYTIVNTEGATLEAAAYKVKIAATLFNAD